MYWVRKEILGVMGEVEMGKVDRGGVVVGVEGCGEGEVVVMELVVLCKGE